MKNMESAVGLGFWLFILCAQTLCGSPSCDPRAPVGTFEVGPPPHTPTHPTPPHTYAFDHSCSGLLLRAPPFILHLSLRHLWRQVD